MVDSITTSDTNNFISDSVDFVFKFVIIGDSNVGKSCLMHHFIYNKCKFIIYN